MNVNCETPILTPSQTVYTWSVEKLHVHVLRHVALVQQRLLHTVLPPCRVRFLVLRLKVFATVRILRLLFPRGPHRSATHGMAVEA